jgi:hypothetical protein
MIMQWPHHLQGVQVSRITKLDGGQRREVSSARS